MREFIPSRDPVNSQPQVRVGGLREHLIDILCNIHCTAYYKSIVTRILETWRQCQMSYTVFAEIPNALKRFLLPHLVKCRGMPACRSKLIAGNQRPMATLVWWDN